MIKRNYNLPHSAPETTMALTRKSSPASESSSTSPTQLTPNSKIKAMLAALDNDSDEESVSGSTRARIAASLPKVNLPKADDAHHTTEQREERSPTPRNLQNESEEDDDEEEILRPKGRLAARMQVQESDSEDGVEPASDDARERVKKLFMAKTKSPGPAPSAEQNDSDENDAPVVSRKRKIRVPLQETPQSSPQKSPASPGLFVSPQARGSTSPRADASDPDELPDKPPTNDRLLALVEKKRQERLTREAAAAQEKAKKAAERKRHSDLLEEDDGDISDDDGGRRLTQQARPTRKASKKALEEMNRETQRLSRNQQLAHNAITKKIITKASLFAKFNFRTAQFPEENVSEPARLTSSSSAADSDVSMQETPPTSPASCTCDVEKSAVVPSLATAANSAEEQEDEELPTLDDVLKQIPCSPPTRLGKGEGKAIEEPNAELEIPKKQLFKQRPIRVRPPKVADRKASPLEDSDSDLEIVTAKTPDLKKKLDSIFDRVPAKQAKESHSFHTLRLLAHLTSPGKQNHGRNKKPSMSTTELQMTLQQRARQQATREREERLQALRDKGVIVQTAEEREKEMAEVEDLIAKARREGEEIMKRERAAAKKESKANGEVDPLGDSSDDEDWEESEENVDEELSGSGSEQEGEEDSGNDGSEASGEEEDEMDVDDEEQAEASIANPMFDNEASESDGDKEEAEEPIDEDMADNGDVNEDVEVEQILVIQKPRRTRKINVISDDEDGDQEEDHKPTPSAAMTVSPVQADTNSPVAPNSVLRSATKTFIPGLTVTGPVGLGLTQIFAGTMDDSQQFEASPTAPNSQLQQMETEQDSMAFLRRLPAPELPSFVPTMEEDSQDVITNSQSQVSHVSESQTQDPETQEIQLDFSQSQVHGFDSLVQDSQMSPYPEATQDIGFQQMTPIRGRFVDGPPSTVDTVVMDQNALPETTEETPIVKKKGKLRRRAQVASFSDEEDAADAVELEVEDDSEITADIFDVMRNASKKKVVVDEFDKKKSKAKEMVNEQAEESEDEYAGLGGASDDESGGEEDAYVKEMIDDEGGKDLDESKLAAFFA